MPGVKVSTGRGSGFKASQKIGPKLKDLSNRREESGILLGTTGYKASDLSTSPLSWKLQKSFLEND